MSVAPVVEPVEKEEKSSSWFSLPSFSSSVADKNVVPVKNEKDEGGSTSWFGIGGKRRGKSNRKAMKGGSFSPYTAHSSASSASQYGGRRTRRHRTRRHKARKARKARKSRKHRR